MGAVNHVVRPAPGSNVQAGRPLRLFESQTRMASAVRATSWVPEIVSGIGSWLPRCRSDGGPGGQGGRGHRRAVGRRDRHRPIRPLDHVVHQRPTPIGRVDAERQAPIARGPRPDDASAPTSAFRPRTTGRPALMTPAFSPAMASIDEPRVLLVRSKSIAVMTAPTGVTTLVASSRPPSPTSRTAISTARDAEQLLERDGRRGLEIAWARRQLARPATRHRRDGVIDLGRRHLAPVDDEALFEADEVRRDVATLCAVPDGFAARARPSRSPIPCRSSPRR